MKATVIRWVGAYGSYEGSSSLKFEKAPRKPVCAATPSFDGTILPMGDFGLALNMRESVMLQGFLGDGYTLNSLYGRKLKLRQINWERRCIRFTSGLLMNYWFNQFKAGALEQRGYNEVVVIPVYEAVIYTPGIHSSYDHALVASRVLGLPLFSVDAYMGLVSERPDWADVKGFTYYLRNRKSCARLMNGIGNIKPLKALRRESFQTGFSYAPERVEFRVYLKSKRELTALRCRIRDIESCVYVENPFLKLGYMNTSELDRAAIILREASKKDRHIVYVLAKTIRSHKNKKVILIYVAANTEGWYGEEATIVVSASSLAIPAHKAHPVWKPPPIWT